MAVLSPREYIIHDVRGSLRDCSFEAQRKMAEGW